MAYLMLGLLCLAALLFILSVSILHPFFQPKGGPAKHWGHLFSALGFFCLGLDGKLCVPYLDSFSQQNATSIVSALVYGFGFVVFALFAYELTQAKKKKPKL